MASRNTCTRSSRRWRRPRLRRKWSPRRTPWSATVLQRQLKGRSRPRTPESRRKIRSRSRSLRNPRTENRPNRGKTATCVLIAGCRARNRASCKNTSELTPTRGRILAFLADSRSRPSRISTNTVDPVLTPLRWRVAMPARYVSHFTFEYTYNKLFELLSLLGLTRYKVIKIRNVPFEFEKSLILALI